MKNWVTRIIAIKKPHYRTKTRLDALWLPENGFVDGVELVAMPHLDGFSLDLPGNAASDYEKCGGKLVRVGFHDKKHSLTLNFGKNFRVPGCEAGDFLAIGYEPGRIRAKKLPEAHKYYIIGHANHVPFLQLIGNWLSDAGFEPCEMGTFAYTRHKICIQHWNAGCDLAESMDKIAEMVRFARSQRWQIVQAKKNQHYTVLDIPGYILMNAGFAEGDICRVCCEKGMVTLEKVPVAWTS